MLDPFLTYDEMKQVWEASTCKIIYPGGVYVRIHKGEIQVYTRQALLNAYEHVRYSIVSSSKKPRGDDDGTVVITNHPFLLSRGPNPCWLHDPKIRHYEKMNIYPPPLVCPPDEFNLWNGFDVERYKAVRHVDTNSSAVKAFINHVHILLNRDQHSTDYVLNWIAQMFQFPSVKAGIALLLKGEEGVGKNRLTDLLKLMMGTDKFFETSKPSTSLYGQFTLPRRNKVLICINEANGKENHANNDILKDMITSYTFVCEGKGENQCMLNCYDRFIFTTNNDNSVRVNPDSRRFAMFEVSSELYGNTIYFTTLTAYIDDPHSRREFYEYLMSRDLSGVDWQNERPRTEYMQEMIEANLPLEQAFIRDKMTRAYRISPAGTTLKYQSTVLFEEFCAWLKQGNHKYETNNIAFGRRISNLTKPNTGLAGCTSSKSGNAIYEFDIDLVCQAMVQKRWMSASRLVRFVETTEADDD